MINREMYICHKDIQKEMINHTYTFIEMCFDEFDDNVLNKDRFIGVMTETFMGFYLKKLELFDGYDIRYTKMFTIE